MRATKSSMRLRIMVAGGSLGDGAIVATAFLGTELGMLAVASSTPMPQPSHPGLACPKNRGAAPRVGDPFTELKERNPVIESPNTGNDVRHGRPEVEQMGLPHPMTHRLTPP